MDTPNNKEVKKEVEEESSPDGFTTFLCFTGFFSLLLLMGALIVTGLNFKSWCEEIEEFRKNSSSSYESTSYGYSFDRTLLSIVQRQEVEVSELEARIEKLENNKNTKQGD